MADNPAAAGRHARASACWAFYSLLFSALAVGAQVWAGGYGADRGLTADESAHFVNSLMIFDFARAGMPADPLRFALDYYRHFPRVSIGHWPPLFYAVQAGAFGVLGRNSAVALLIQALVLGMAAALAAALAERRQGFAVGLATGVVVLASPVLLFLVDAVMVDTFLSVLILLSTVAWARYAQSRRAAWAIAFALCAASAILTKGNAIGLALLPPFYALLARDGRILLAGGTLAAAALTCLLTAPWYLLTYRMAADGFTYGWGWHYTSHALPAYILALAGAVGPLVCLGMMAALVGRLRRRSDCLTTALMSAVLAILVFQSLVPADIQPRYVAAIVPAAALLGAQGLVDLGTAVARLWNRPDATPAIVAAALLTSIAIVFRPPHTAPMHSERLAQAVMAADPGNPLVLVATSARTEGAVIAAFAERDAARRHWILRGTKLLAAGNFMGTEYQARFATNQDVGAFLAANGIGWIIIDDAPDSLELQHNRQVLALVQSQDSGWKLVQEVAHPSGDIRLYATSTPAPIGDVDKLLRQIAPATVADQD